MPTGGGASDLISININNQSVGDDSDGNPRGVLTTYKDTFALKDDEAAVLDTTTTA